MCQVDYICKCLPASIQGALDELPETLDETYERTLREITKPQREYAHRLFQFVAVASRPLRVEELSGLLAFKPFKFEAGRIPKFEEGLRPEDPVHAVLSTCSSLFTVVDGGSLPETADGGSPSEADDSESRSDFSDRPVSASEVFEEEIFPKGADDEFR